MTTTTTQVETTNNTPVNANVVAPVASNVAWQWPTQGNVIQGFSNTDGGNKGIDISGSLADKRLKLPRAVVLCMRVTHYVATVT